MRLVSILVPTFNRAGLVSEAIDSVLAQDYPELELIVCDDGSSDDTQAVLAEYARQQGDRFRVERHANRGFVRTVNRGFELARGDLLSLLPDDDLLRPGAISALVAGLEGNPAAVLAYSGYDVIDDDGEVRSTVEPPLFTVAEALRLYWMTVAGPGAVFERSAFERVGGWDLDLRWTADFDFWLKLGKLGPFVRLAEPLAAKRAHAGAYSMGLRGPEKARDRVRLVEKFYAADDVGAEALAVRDEAFRAAYVDAAISAAPGINGPDERFYIADRLLPKLAATPDSDLSAQISELKVWVRELEARLAERDERLATRERELEARDRRIAVLEQPMWLVAWKRWVPQPLRALAWRLLGRLLGSIRRRTR